MLQKLEDDESTEKEQALRRLIEEIQLKLLNM